MEEDAGMDEAIQASTRTLWHHPLPPQKPAPGPSIESLTEREMEVLQMVSRGMSNQAIADTFVLSERTVRTHVSNILSKLDLHNRTEATLVALDSGLAYGRIVQTYLHRNGETEPPTQQGAYWMEISEPLQRDHVLLGQAPWGEWRMRRSNTEWEPYRPHHLRMIRARFWGPMEPPWEEENS